jgi:hypothetical protein
MLGYDYPFAGYDYPASIVKRILLFSLDKMGLKPKE